MASRSLLSSPVRRQLSLPRQVTEAGAQGQGWPRVCCVPGTLLYVLSACHFTSPASFEVSATVTPNLRLRNGRQAPSLPSLTPKHMAAVPSHDMHEGLGVKSEDSLVKPPGCCPCQLDELGSALSVAKLLHLENSITAAAPPEAQRKLREALRSAQGLARGDCSANCQRCKSNRMTTALTASTEVKDTLHPAGESYVQLEYRVRLLSRVQASFCTSLHACSGVGGTQNGFSFVLSLQSLS